ncbi:histone acetyltransferase NGG1 [Kluyveromyces lactis]|uniref:KLLA0D18073p n=1 Tax=Kluyveromyces lactis (strain ATCC 8585 / CBS 2359 / DSM 70799 / NBRC 1267 / NRRL Y-1140 / WM37) TaxID=284590 RepID=Q6CQC9_KLULA|nr:uncharacterized protein KLLA0_D18073g [Kluyveromyces lactis]CAH00956.1 KLLA0D18073p [Kluyveromyces lactis]|eukprot:XP_453860.1 uncharacterized protein KLLA0_D18073g [Kluyveromyces lactis]
MSRNTRRGKGIREQKRDDAGLHEPSNILNSMLKSLDLTFENDIGLLNGKYVRSVPEKPVLQTTKDQLENLGKCLEKIAASDQENLDLIKEMREDIIRLEDEKQKEKEEAEAATNLAAQNAENDSINKKLDESSEVVSDKRSITEENEETDKRPQDTIEEAEVLSSDGHISKKAKLDIDKMENDPNIRNPKSEFVVSQTLPAAAMRLGLFQEEGLEATGEEYLKKKYGVVSYPTNDLKELLPGELPDMDFSKPKPTNQIQFNTFLSSIEAFYREFNDDDIKFLQNKFIMPQNLQFVKSYDPEVTPYTIPKLGPLYTDVWLKEDNNQNIANLTPPPISDPISILPKKSGNDISDGVLDNEEVSCGPLVSRLLSAILKDDDIIAPKEELPTNPTLDSSVSTPVSELEHVTPSSSSSYGIFKQHGAIANNSNIDYVSFEERLKRELKYVGIYMNLPREEGKTREDPDWLTGREDDEISAELRELQSTLRQVTTKNTKRKAMLLPLLERMLAWQEYCTILDNLDKQVDQAYIKRIRAPKNKKKRQYTPGPDSLATGSTSQAAIQAAHQQAANSSLKSLLDKRQRWISKIGPLFDKPEVMKRIPRDSVFKDIDQDEEEEEADVFSNNANGKEEELNETLQNKEE